MRFVVSVSTLILEDVWKVLVLTSKPHKPNPPTFTSKWGFQSLSPSRREVWREVLK
jgi:hypothetical protein